ncbi:lysophospholipase [Periweissella cryptocerci]|uniref:Lysophospholipase n=1 Tax=Periweissella cryptocerci TaxID=2506420 RepID=A0A4P6YU36_9LACO|nr:GDSL-type esterase/lipase family protein [Periweissella cryptocerci]QBO36230.1 lysophospholipase [Periweissella cryptocerci]
MTEETTKLTMNPKIVEFQAGLRAKYAEANKTAKKGQIDFVGSSLMEIFPIEKMQQEQDLGLDKAIYNRGVRATTTADLLAHMDTLIFDLAPSKIFINIGSNDIGFKVPEVTFLANYAEIMRQIKAKLPETKVYVMAYYPTNQVDFGQDADDIKLNQRRGNDRMAEYNAKVEQLAADNGLTFINVNAGLTDDNGNLRKELTVDGAHMLPAGFEIVLANLQPYLA